jgi:general secretion pathway protein N
MTKAKLLILGVCSYLLFTLLMTPASWWLKLATLPPQLQLGQVSGTLWQGSVSAARYQQLDIGALRWQLNGWALFSAKLQFDVQSGSMQTPQLPFIAAVASYGIRGAQLSQALLKLPVAQILPLLDLPLPVDASGDLALDIAEFSQGQPWCQSLSGQASWQDARLLTPAGNWLELQSLFGELRCADGTIVLTTDGNNVLGLDIKAVINAGQLLVNGTLKPDAAMPKEVHQAMQFLGRPDAQGRYTIRF